MYRQHQYAESGAGSRGPEILYGYCHHSRQMRMMNLADFMNNMQTGYANFYGNPASALQPAVNALSSVMPGSFASRLGRHSHRDERHEHGCGHECGCGRECGCCEDDCHCSCCIRCADIVEHARCGEIRVIPVTFDNDSRRERDVKLVFGGFATAGGKDLGWETSFSESEFKLPPCGEKTVLIRVLIDCAKFGNDRDERLATVDECKVAYGTVRAEGCLVCPLVIAVAVLPSDCGAYRAGCLCCCCC